MFVFTTLRAHYDFAEEKVMLDNTFGFYFAFTLERVLREKFCIEKEISCLKCKYNKICQIPKLFWSEIIFNQPPRIAIKVLNQGEELERKRHELVLEITLVGDTFSNLEMLVTGLRNLTEIPPYTPVKFKGLYAYDYLSGKEIEKIEPENLKNIPKYSGSMILDLNTGKNEVKVKIFSSFLPKNVVDGLINEKDIEENFIKLLESKTKLTLEFLGCNQPISFYGGGFTVKKIYAKELLVEDINVKKVAKDFPDHTFFEGKFLLQGNIGYIYPLLSLAEILNVGKLTSLGFGRLKLIETATSKQISPQTRSFI